MWTISADHSGLSTDPVNPSEGIVLELFTMATLSLPNTALGNVPVLTLQIFVRRWFIDGAITLFLLVRVLGVCDLILPRCESCGHSGVFARNPVFRFYYQSCSAAAGATHQWNVRWWMSGGKEACLAPTVDSAELPLP